MAIQLQCPSCRSTLQVPDYLAGRKVRCPKCRGVADVGPLLAGAPPASLAAPAMAAEDKASPRRRPDSDKVRVRARKPAPVPEPEMEDAEEVPDRPRRPTRSSSRREEAISTRPIRRNEATETEEDEEEEEVARTRRFKRRKQRRPKRRSSPANWSFIWWLVIGGIYLAAGAGISYYKVATGETFELIMGAVGWAVLMPISVFILIGSMMAASAIAGGIDFGDLRTAIPKAFFLLAPINFLVIVCPWYVHMFFTPLFWIFGLIILFGLDLWETFFLMTINWILSYGAKVLVILMVVALIFGQISKDLGKDKASPDDPGDDQMAAPVQKDPPKLPSRLRR